MFFNHYGQPCGRQYLDSSTIFRLFIEFIKSSIWTLPVASFIEQKSLVFDREQEDIILYRKIHREFVSLVDALMECFCDDIHIKAEHLVIAMRESHFNAQMTPTRRALLEPVAAAQDFEVFVSMMTRRNIELQLQAIQMIEIICGLVPAVLCVDDDQEATDLKQFQQHPPAETNTQETLAVKKFSDGNLKDVAESSTESSNAASKQNDKKAAAKNTTTNAKDEASSDKSNANINDDKSAKFKAWDEMVKNLKVDPNEYENNVLIQVLRESKKEFVNDTNKTLNELEKARQEIETEKPRLQKSRENEEANFKKALNKNINATNNDGSGKSRKTKAKLDEKLPKIEPNAAAITITNPPEATKTIQEIHALLKEPKRINTANIEQRKDYLQKQRDKLLAMKKVVREKQFKAATTNTKVKAERPRTAQAARQAMSGTVPQPTHISPEILAARHEMALKLKTNLHTSHHSSG